MITLYQFAQQAGQVVRLVDALGCERNQAIEEQAWLAAAKEAPCAGEGREDQELTEPAREAAVAVGMPMSWSVVLT